MIRALARGLAAIGSGAAVCAFAAQPLGCIIEPYHVAEVGSPVIGVIDAIHVERGDRVARGQPLASLRADVERASVSVASSRAMASGELNAAAASAELGRQKLARARDLFEQKFISEQALEQARAEATVAENRLAQAREQRNVFLREQELAQAQLNLRTIRAPSAGVIADRYLSAGERVEEKAIFRLAVVDPLRVEVVLPARMFAGMRPGQGMVITPEFPNAAPRQARVVLVDKLIDGASNTFRVRLELPNADLRLPAGLRCKAELDAHAPASTQAPAGTAARRATAAERGPAPGAGGALNLRIDTTLGGRPPHTRP